MGLDIDTLKSIPNETSAGYDEADELSLDLNKVFREKDAM